MSSSSTESPLPPDFPRQSRGAAIGGRLRRLSEAIDREAALAYRAAGVEFEQRWFGPLNLLDRYGPLSVGEIAQTLGVSHAAVSQVRTILAARGLIGSMTDAADGRRRVLSLTNEGRRLIARLRPLWDRMDRAAQALNDEAGDVVLALDALEAALERRSLLDRIADEP